MVCDDFEEFMKTMKEKNSRKVYFARVGKGSSVMLRAWYEFFVSESWPKIVSVNNLVPRVEKKKAMLTTRLLEGLGYEKKANPNAKDGSWRIGKGVKNYIYVLVGSEVCESDIKKYLQDEQSL